MVLYSWEFTIRTCLQSSPSRRLPWLSSSRWLVWLFKGRRQREHWHFWQQGKILQTFLCPSKITPQGGPVWVGVPDWCHLLQLLCDSSRSRLEDVQLPLQLLSDHWKRWGGEPSHLWERRQNDKCPGNTEAENDRKIQPCLCLDLLLPHRMHGVHNPPGWSGKRRLWRECFCLSSPVCSPAHLCCAVSLSSSLQVLPSLGDCWRAGARRCERGVHHHGVGRHREREEQKLATLYGCLPPGPPHSCRHLHPLHHPWSSSFCLPHHLLSYFSLLWLDRVRTLFLPDLCEDLRWTECATIFTLKFLLHLIRKVQKQYVALIPEFTIKPLVSWRNITDPVSLNIHNFNLMNVGIAFVVILVSSILYCVKSPLLPSYPTFC